MKYFLYWYLDSFDNGLKEFNTEGEMMAYCRQIQEVGVPAANIKLIHGSLYSLIPAH